MDARLIGRARERAVLRSRLEAGAAGRGALVLVTGEPGIGKSTLLDDLVVEAGRRGVPAVTSRAVPDEGVPELWPWRVLLGRAAALGLPVSPDLLDPDPLAGGSFDPVSVSRFRAMDRTVDALHAAAAATPGGLVIILDDLHWADAATLTLLRHLVRELGETPLVVVGSVREPDPDGTTDPRRQDLLDDLRRGPAVEVLHLRPLAGDEVSAYVRDATRRELDPQWLQFLAHHSGGNPLFLRELTRLLEQEGRLDDPTPPASVPAGLTRLVVRRVSGLTPAGQRVLGACSIVADDIEVDAPAGDVDLGLVRIMLGDSADDLDAALAEALAAGVLVEDVTKPTTVRFAHGVIQRACYDTLARTDRVTWHRRAADALERREWTDRAGDLARHRLRAVVDADSAGVAAGAAVRAADRAVRGLAFDEAAYWYGTGADLLLRADRPESERAEALVARADALYRGGQITGAIEAARLAVDLAESAGRADLVAAAALVVRNVGGPVCVDIAALCARARSIVAVTETVAQAKLMALQALALTEAYRNAEAEPLSRQAMALADTTGDSDARILAIQARHNLAWAPGGEVERVELSEKLLAIGADEDRPEATLWATLWRVDMALQTGNLAEVDGHVRELEQQVARLGWPLARWHLLRAQATRALLSGNLALAADLAGQARDVAAQTQDVSAQGLYFAFVGDVLTLQGRLDWIAAGVRAMVEVFEDAPIAIGLATLGRHMLTAGNRDLARTAMDRLRHMLPVAVDMRYLPTMAMTGELAAGLGETDLTSLCYEAVRPYEAMMLYSTTGNFGSAHRSLGVMAAGLGRVDEAIEHVREAVERERRAGAVPYLAVAQLELAGLLVRRGGPGDRSAAEQAAQESRAVARRLGLVPTERAASALLEEVRGVAAGPGALTAREREIAGFLADGLSNRAIAERLVLSERTVETHVRSILAKLGLANRTQVAAWAGRLRT